MDAGLADKVAVTGAGGGGGGGGGFFLPPQPTASAPRTDSMTTKSKRFLVLFTSCPPKFASCARVNSTNGLLKTPVWLTVPAFAGELLPVGAIGQHAPDLLRSADVGLIDNVPSIRRPGRKIIAPAVVRQLYDSP